jgi:hypothetical protein
MKTRPTANLARIDREIAAMILREESRNGEGHSDTAASDEDERPKQMTHVGRGERRCPRHSLRTVNFIGLSKP